MFGRNKRERMVDAQKWCKILEEDKKYSTAIRNAIVSYNHWTVEKLVCSLPSAKYGKTIQEVYKNDVVVCTKASILKGESDDKVCIIDFASYTSPGGGYTKGANAQEESLCSQSGLYPILSGMTDIYTRHRAMINDHLYNNDAFYCNGVPIMAQQRKPMLLSDIVVIAAPNANRARRNGRSYVEINSVISERMEVAFLLPAVNGCNVLIAGAFGCGVFGNDAKFVAEMWNKLACEKYHGLYRTIVHPVLGDSEYKLFSSLIRSS